MIPMHILTIVELDVAMANVFEIKKITATPSSSMFIDTRSFGPYLPLNISNKNVDDPQILRVH
jgi:hypothetical protein